MMVDAIRLEKIVKTYRAKWRRERTLAVNEVSFSVHQGEAFGFIGPNGAGKSTAIKIITGLISPDSGRAEIFGVSVNRAEARKMVGYVPENPYLFDYLTPIEIMLMSMRLNGFKIKDERKHCKTWLERFELAHVANKTIRSFSKGMTQRVALAQAMCFNPRLLILDEPLSGLDPIGRRDVVELLAEYKRSGGTVFFTSHVLHDVERLADRFGLIHKGKISAVQAPSELVGEEELMMVRSAGAAPVAGMNEEFPGRWIAELPYSDLWKRLEDLRVAGHKVVEIRSTLSLERAFMKAVGRGESLGATSPRN